jgi:hypothetical protein
MRGFPARLARGMLRSPVDPQGKGAVPLDPTEQGGGDGERIGDAATPSGPAGLSLAGYARSHLLAAPPVRQARRPPVERAELARLLAELGKIGSNVNQIARALNGGGDAVPSDLAGAQADIAAIRAAIMLALGRAPGEP